MEYYSEYPSVSNLARRLEGLSLAGMASDAAIYFDNKLQSLLSDASIRSEAERLSHALRSGLVAQSEFDDLTAIYALAEQGPEREVETVESLAVWQAAAGAWQYEQLLKLPADRLFYVITVLARRLERRSKPNGTNGPRRELDIRIPEDSREWYPIVANLTPAGARFNLSL